MKFHTTKKAVNASFAVKIQIPYCDLQTLLTFENPIAYTARREGWAADIYDMGGGVAIVTGYAPFGNVRPGYEVCRRYEEQGRKIRYDYSMTWEEQRDALRELLEKFVKEVTGRE